jgi:hypothetical protein
VTGHEDSRVFPDRFTHDANTRQLPLPLKH